MKIHLMVALLAAALVVVGAGLYAEDKADPLAALKCPVSGKKINPEAKVEFKEGHVYFCCEGCPGAFKENTAKFTPKANHQLVASGQYSAKACPIAGKKINPETAIDVGGVKVAFCCNGCKGKAEKAVGDDQVALLFGDEAFEKGFEKAKTE